MIKIFFKEDWMPPFVDRATFLIAPMVAMTTMMLAFVLVPVALFLFTRLVLVMPVVLLEPASLGAIRRSWVLTRRHGWRIFGTLLLFAVIAVVAQLAVSTVLGSVILLVFGAGAGLTTGFVLSAIVNACVQALMMLLLAAFQAKLYAARALEVASAA